MSAFRCAVATLALLPALASAAPTQDYATQWPLTLSGADAGAYRVVLDASVYREVLTPALSDVSVINRDGDELPAALFAPDQPLAQSPRAVTLPLFPLPTEFAGGQPRTGDLSVVAERNTDGSVLRIEARSATVQAAPAQAWLVDASALRGDAVALELDWSTQSGSFERSYRVEASDDLRAWRTVDARVPLLDLREGDRRLRQGRIALSEQARYYKILPLQTGAGPGIVAVRALVPSAAVATDWQWRELSGTRLDEDGRAVFEFKLDGRFPIRRVDVAMPGNHAIEWQLESRDADDVSWQPRVAPWMAFSIASGGRGDRSPPRELLRDVRDRYWRLSTRSAVPAAPTLRLGYRPEVLVFLAQGEPPYRLVAGSARVRRPDAPLPQLVDALRSERGIDWQPAVATLTVSSALAGTAAHQPPATPRNWRNLALWGVLLLCAGVVAAFSLSLLRGARAGPADEG